ncbi:receptor protein-tyrosine kinase [Caenorhabditis elegans]|uniref:receptor protein-tyrosine kinase n=1 Tax=Caenorhabditis elegans TaxID=6239 RepID=Q95ZK1_CAEEL|nr:Protein kinase domain-containing protein [Caenorhabditis elegans]CAC42353.2 Protein kinase domain-containing protein [Caenorhabditis elegans]|eukprot:NP_492969.2 Uncharacterized protein CELE_W04G5.10 [Caenorhabditis elegans]
MMLRNLFPIFIYIIFVLLFLALSLFLLYIWRRILTNSSNSDLGGSEEDVERSLLTTSLPISNKYDLDRTRIQTESELISETIKSLIGDNHLEIDPENLKISTENYIGSGFFGTVYRAELRRERRNSNFMIVAVKEPSNIHNIRQKKILHEELNVMCSMEKHPNILSLVGVVTQRNVMIVTEYVEDGDLLKFLRKCKFDKDSVKLDEKSLCKADLFSFTFQIANGMQYLERVPCVHRDLALRNVLIKNNGVLKIADFGLARRHDKKDYYRTKTTDTALPIKWLAPECFEEEEEKIRFDSKSDVWSYGVCLYEIFSLGESPYNELDSNNFAFLQVLADFLRKGNTLSEPEHCAPKMYYFMKSCWNLIPEERPSFTACTNFSRTQLNQLSNEFCMETIGKIDNEANEQRCLGRWT